MKIENAFNDIILIAQPCNILCWIKMQFRAGTVISYVRKQILVTSECSDWYIDESIKEHAKSHKFIFTFPYLIGVFVRHF